MDNARKIIRLSFNAIEAALDAEDVLDGDMPDDVYEALHRARGACIRWLRNNPPDEVLVANDGDQEQDAAQEVYEHSRLTPLEPEGDVGEVNHKTD